MSEPIDTTETTDPAEAKDVAADDAADEAGEAPGTDDEQDD